MLSATSSVSLLALLLCSVSTGFITPMEPLVASRSTVPKSPTSLHMAGFGSSKAKAGGSKLPKLKAKAQWDRYADLKNCLRVRVGVRVKETDHWLEVGKVKSEDGDLLEAAIARQRALIAEHAKRLYLVQVPPNAVLDWGYLPASENEEDGEWLVVDKTKGDDAPSGIEKKIGFEGIPDKNTGFYCYYHEGRIVAREEIGKGKKKSDV